MADLQIIRADYADPRHGEAIVDMLNLYALDPMGGASPLGDYTRQNLVEQLRSVPGAFSLLAFQDGQAVGLANCFTGFSTFAAKPLVNIHDVVVNQSARGQGVGKRLFVEIEAIARQLGACKVTLEVLSGNERAKGLYSALGYGDYELDPEMGHALFWQKEMAA